MHNENTLQLTRLEGPEVPKWVDGLIRCTPGKVAVEMAPPADRIGHIFMPETVSSKLRPDVGTVIACEPPRDKRGEPLRMNLFFGDTVLVRPYDGAWFDGFENGPYKPDNQVRFYGIAGEPSLYQASKGQMGDRRDTGVSHQVWWSESIVAKVVGDVVLPTEGNLLIRPLDVETPFVLPDGVGIPSKTGVILASGVDSLRKGQKVAYKLHETVEELEIELDGDALIIRHEQVLAVVE
jgi:co-chaperonin GroES (HSP10)